MRSFASLAFLFLGAAMLDWWWHRFLPIAGVAPSWLFVSTVALAAVAGPVPAQVLGVGWGLFRDALSAHLFGANLLAYGVAAYVVGQGRRLLDLSSVPSQAVFVAIVSVAYSLLYATLGSIFLERFLWPGWRGLLGVPLANAIAAPFAFYYLRRWQTQAPPIR